MRGGATTYYGTSTTHRYEYSSQVWKLLGGELGKVFMTGDGRKLHHTPADSDDVTAVLSSYSYRCTPFYCRRRPDNYADYPGSQPADWDTADESYFSTKPTGGKYVAEWALEHTKPVVKAEFMTPPFKTRRALSGRAVAADSFDFGSPAETAFRPKGGMANAHHKNGYHVLYVEGAVQWWDDSGKVVGAWTDWPTAPTGQTQFYGFENLTISSPTSQDVWNLFDRAMAIDVE